MKGTSSPAVEAQLVAPDARVAGADADVLVVGADPHELAGSDLTVTAERKRRRVREEVDFDAVRAELLAVGQQTLQPAAAVLWLRDPTPVTS